MRLRPKNKKVAMLTNMFIFASGKNRIEKMLKAYWTAACDEVLHTFMNTNDSPMSEDHGSPLYEDVMLTGIAV